MGRKIKTRWVVLGIAGLAAVALTACGKIPQGGSSGNKAGKNLYIQSFAPATYTTASGSLTDNTCPPTVIWGSTSTSLSTPGDVVTWVVIKNDSYAASSPTDPENTNIHIQTIRVEFEVPGATMQLDPYVNPYGYTITPGGTLCAGAIVFPQTAKDFINKNRSAFPANPTANHSFQVRAKVSVHGYETNGGYRINTPEAYFTIYVKN